MLQRDLAKHVAEISRQRQVASFVKLIVLQPGPFSINLTAAYAVAHDEHRVRMSVVRAAVTVLSHRAAKLRHRQHHDIVHSLAQVLIKRSKAGAELLQEVCELSTSVALVHVRVPAADVGALALHTSA